MTSQVLKTGVARLLKASMTIFVLVALSTVSSPRPALAICHNCAYQAAYEVAVNAAHLASRVLQMTQRATATAGEIGADAALTTSQAKTTQAVIDDGRMRVHERQAQQIAMDLSMPPDFNYCGLASSARGMGGLNDNLGQRAAAYGRASLPNKSVAAVVENEAVRGRLGFLPCKADGTMEDRLHRKMKCTEKSGKYANADLTLSAVFARDQMLVPPELAEPVKVGKFTPIPDKDYEDKYIPFLAGYSYCQNLAPKIENGIASDKVTVGSINNTRNNEVFARVAYDLCMRFLLDRAQYESGKGENALQAKTCWGRNKVKLMDDAAYASCKKNGRSKMQLLRDGAYFDQSDSYHKDFSKMMTPDGLLYMDSAAVKTKRDYERLVTRQRETLARAIQVARRGANLSGNANMDIPAK